MAAIFAQGTLIKKGDGGAPEAFATIAQVKTISGPTMRSALLDVTTQDSASGVIERISGLIDPGEISFDINYDPANGTHVALLADFLGRDQDNYRILMIGGVEWEMLCQVVGFELAAPVDNVLSAAVTLAILGKPDFAAT